MSDCSQQECVSPCHAYSQGLSYLEPHDRGVRDGGLVEVVQAVDDAQQRHEVEVDLAQQLLLLLGRHGDDLAVKAGCEHLEGLVGVRLVGVPEDGAGLDIGLGLGGLLLLVGECRGAARRR